ncbi:MULTISPECIES: hypothetical protein [Vagococcus]|uniref:Uncharacterized protein n=1 Tax=Vagococcus fluvialis bH819 TaxID=1255619 RepID=A0A1X6WMI6_9ENTE|nr:MULTISPECIES: hypothetical protein [Vagococcus]SLM85487.1 hypothetical protein FM121_05265 [Vagococcus fluvialis bH819]HCM89218.1 hypothetical protein [Vagococcus sp.]
MIPEEQVENKEINDDVENKLDATEQQSDVGNVSRVDNASQQKSNKNKIISIVVIILALLIGVIGYQQMNNKSSTKKVETQVVDKKSEEAKTGKDTREAMTGVADLYSDMPKKEVRTDIKKTEFKKAEENVSKLEDGKLKEGLTNQLKEVETAMKDTSKK